MKPTQRDSASRLIRDYGLAILIAVFLALLIRYFVLEAYRIPSVAMRPSLEPGDTIFVTKFTYGVRSPFSASYWTPPRIPRSGDVVVFSPPEDPDRDFVRRVVGVPGDRVAMKGGRLRVNGVELSEDPGQARLCGREATYQVCWEPPLPADLPEQVVPEGSVYVLGDLRTRPADSRQRTGNGLIPVSSLKGRALWVWLSIEPAARREEAGWFSRIRFERMFRRIQ